MKQLATMVVLCVLLMVVSFSQRAFAYDPFWSIKGSTVAGGSHYSRQSVFSAIYPGAQESVKQDDWTAMIALPYNVHGYYEFVDVAHALDDINLLIEDLGDTSSLLSARSLASRAEGILNDFERFGTVINGSLVSNQLLPVIVMTHPAIAGTLSFEYQGNGLVAPSRFAARFTEDPIDVTIEPAAFAAGFTSETIRITPASCVTYIDALRGGTATDNQLRSCYDDLSEEQRQTLCPGDVSSCTPAVDVSVFDFASDSTINVQAVTSYDNFIFGYSRQVWERTADSPWTSGTLYAGTRISYSHFESVVVSSKLTELHNKKLNDVVKDLLDDDNKITSGGVGLDAGVSWRSERYSVGLTVKNLLAPDVEYDEERTINPGLVPSIDAAFFLNQSQSWAVQIQNDFSAVQDLSGVEHQWRVLALSYTSTSWIIPGFALSKRWNIAGHKLAYSALGLQLFKLLQFNVAVSDDNISGVPRSTIFSAGFGFDI